MKKDAFEFSRACDKCQRYANYYNSPVAPLTSLMSPWPFSIWGIHLIGELPKAKGGVKYAVVAVDFFTKWAEVEPLATITAKKLKKFVHRTIVCRCGIPYKLISDNGKQFDSKEMRGFWAGSFRRDNYDLEANEVNHRLYLNMIEETREDAQIRIAIYQQRTARHYNSKVRARTFKVGDLVMRRVMPNTKVVSNGVFGENWEGPYKIKSVLWEGTYHLNDMQDKLIPRA
ncbi:uncharacterized protein LOC141690833 [Apium graveolens]|uniref:uncharacterized protein LOC141690833 n=1 Tax=Apium graveolens TaxID=4045 RepID=UPI003D7A6C7E